MGGKAGGTLQYTSNSINSYPAIFDNALGKVPSNEKQEVVTALKQLSTGKDLEKYFDVDQILRYFAAHTVLVSYDSYYSNMAQNYVIAQHNGKLSVLPWDYHLSFGSFQTGQASAVVNAPIDTPVTGVEMADRPLLNQLLSNPKYLAQYHTYLQDIVDGYYGGGVFSQHVSDLKAKISSHVKADPSAFYSYAKFEAGVKTLTTLCEARAKSIAGQLAGTIPATTQGQTDNNDTLIDASSIDLANLGTNGPGRLMNNTRQREN